MKDNKALERLKKFSVNKLAPFWSIAPVVIFLIAVCVIVTFGVKTKSISSGFGIGIDFEGGTLLNVKLGKMIADEKGYKEHADKLKAIAEKNGVVVSYIQKEKADNADDHSISLRYKNNPADRKSDAKIAERNEKILKAIDDAYPDIVQAHNKFIDYQSIGASAASDLLSKAGISVLVSTILILIYIMIRFTPVAAIAAIIALLHDVILMFALTTIFRIQINASFVAAIITIIAYSINDTIVIFDRCREEVKKNKGMKKIDYSKIGDKSVLNTATRSIYTTITTMITIVLLAAIGGTAIREFSIPIIFGLLVGLYSSIFLSVPMWTAFSKLDEYVKKQRAIRHASNENIEIVQYEEKAEDNTEEEKSIKKEKKKKVTNSNVIYKYKKKKDEIDKNEQ